MFSTSEECEIGEGPSCMIQDLICEIESCDIMSSKLIKLRSNITALLNHKHDRYWDQPFLPISDLTMQWLLHIQNELAVDDSYFF